MNATQLKAALRRAKPNAERAEIDSAVAKIDQDALLKKHRVRYTSKIWDEVTPINGVPAEQILARHDIPKDTNRRILLIYVDGRLSRIQPHDPDESGFVALTEADCDESNPESKVSKHLNDLAQMDADREAMETALSLI